MAIWALDRVLHAVLQMDYPDDREVLETFECEGPLPFR